MTQGVCTTDSEHGDVAGGGVGVKLVKTKDGRLLPLVRGVLPLDGKKYLLEIHELETAKRKKQMLRGWGVGDLGYTTKHPAYAVWKNLIPKVYTYLNIEECLKGNPDLMSGICGEWLYFPNFAKWFDEQKESRNNKWQLDKDLFGVYYRHYSPETCCLLHPDINKLLRFYYPQVGIEQRKRSGKWYLKSAKYSKLVAKNEFDTMDDAYFARANCIRDEVTKIADSCRDMFSDRVYHQITIGHWEILRSYYSPSVDACAEMMARKDSEIIVEQAN